MKEEEVEYIINNRKRNLTMQNIIDFVVKESLKELKDLNYGKE